MSAAVAVPAARISSPPGEVSPPPRISPGGEDFAIPGVELTATAARVVGDLSPDELAAALSRIADRERGSRWWLGDLLAFGDRVHGVTYAEFAARTGLNVETLYNRVSMSKKVPPDVRLPEDELTWAAHRPVQALADPEVQRKWLGLAADQKWSEKRLREAIQKEGESQTGEGGFGAFSGGGDNFPDPLSGGAPCSHCGGTGIEPENAA